MTRPRSAAMTAFRRGVLAAGSGLVMIGCGRRLPHLPVITPMLSPLVASFQPPQPMTSFEESFARLDLARWREIEVRGRTDYAVDVLEGASCLKAHSHDGASVLLAPSRVHPHADTRLSWRWRVDRFVDGEDLTRKEGSDASARVYVYFDTLGLPWQKRSLDYVWSATLPVGTVLESAYSNASKILVVESGVEHRGQWRSAARMLADDYHRCFGTSPPTVVSIGVMVDTDNTHGEALAYFDDIRISREHP